MKIIKSYAPKQLIKVNIKTLIKSFYWEISSFFIFNNFLTLSCEVSDTFLQQHSGFLDNPVEKCHFGRWFAKRMRLCKINMSF